MNIFRNMTTWRVVTIYWQRSLSVILVLLLSVSMGGCLGLFGQSLGSITGQVFDSSGAGVSQATVTVAGTSLATQTDDQGHFTIEVLHLAQDTLSDG